MLIFWRKTTTTKTHPKTTDDFRRWRLVIQHHSIAWHVLASRDFLFFFFKTFFILHWYINEDFFPPYTQGSVSNQNIFLLIGQERYMLSLIIWFYFSLTGTILRCLKSSHIWKNNNWKMLIFHNLESLLKCLINHLF